MTISLIAAMSENRVIGRKGLLPWGHLPADWAYLHRITAGKKMIMGRKSYDTPDRVWSEAGNIVLTRQRDYVLDEGFERADSLTMALEMMRPTEREVFVIGGGEVFKEAIGLADTIYLTIVHGIFEGDAFFPPIDSAVFQLFSQIDYPADADNQYAYSFLVYKKLKKTFRN